MKNYLRLHLKYPVVIALTDLAAGEKIERVTIKAAIAWFNVWNTGVTT